MVNVFKMYVWHSLFQFVQIRWLVKFPGFLNVSIYLHTYLCAAHNVSLIRWLGSNDIMTSLLKVSLEELLAMF